MMSMRTGRANIKPIDARSDTSALREEVLDGILGRPRTLPSKYFYDARGSALFDRICELDEYYLTRAELAIMERSAGEMVASLGPGCLLVELGSGSSLKTRVLLDRIVNPAGYVPIDISSDHLAASARRLAHSYPDLHISAVCADYTDAFTLPLPDDRVERVAVYFPGSTIGNFEPDGARRFLERVATICGRGGALLIGVDLQKDPLVLESAYNDDAGVTADFNKNVLHRMNRELGSSFDVDSFAHEAVYNEGEGRIEMYLVSRVDQRVKVDGTHVDFESGERICTEYSYKYTVEGFAQLAGSAGFRVERVWTDAEQHFSVQLLTAAS